MIVEGPIEVWLRKRTRITGYTIESIDILIISQRLVIGSSPIGAWEERPIPLPFESIAAARKSNHIRLEQTLVVNQYDIEAFASDTDERNKSLSGCVQNVIIETIRFGGFQSYIRHLPSTDQVPESNHR